MPPHESSKDKESENLRKKYLKYKNKYLSTKILKGGSSNDISKWKYGDKIKPSLDKVIQEHGNPDILINKKGGICIWNNLRDGTHHSIEIRDEYVEHCVPKPHRDYLYSYVHMFVPAEMREKVLGVSGSVGYDGLKKLLYARCASLEANMATIRTVFEVMNKKNKKYAKNINEKDTSYEGNKKFVKEQLENNNKRFKKELKQPFDPLAFPDGCKN